MHKVIRNILARTMVACANIREPTQLALIFCILLNLRLILFIAYR